jgi:hypothetical protein
MKLKPLIIPAINIIVWGWLVWSGFDGEKYVEARVGYASLGQIEWYVVYPAVMISVAVIPAALLSQTKWAYLGNIWSILALLSLIPYMFFYTGGM